MLHIVKSVTALEDVVKVYIDGDVLLLIEDAVYSVNPQHKTYPLIKGLNTFVLRNDLAARGILNRTSPSIETVDYESFVDLTSEQENSLTWD
ncbi:sulfurtransferase complex subunit TusB [Vibrio neptunius]|uniref:Sulfurtransferase complex subunit TusB n=1 Tax=Vibrio neptunius TaxID=170651 RepID=A0ABS3A7M5_9VIBR|nr:sulfurtransferase complex subunit TusB [Vibrio neptunius]MBN3495643.1 sulfurtransferase complex subunit TusB [Vibrio neptunius]MBN3518085.1 sulfurtransferase complex subunit TusB [Vibrio neptunius]MBN3552428.1 sulfurtransferase complex subunit TusB [Vibrio neptunius]MBN3580476.1 sulfurtransferase complex subunit TusB [Vibrio neptunius]MCH9874143.1 sulfurtransferase complex subunit TusB [Vibrio neptunius]